MIVSHDGGKIYGQFFSEVYISMYLVSYLFAKFKVFWCKKKVDFPVSWRNSARTAILLNILCLQHLMEKNFESFHQEKFNVGNNIFGFLLDSICSTHENTSLSNISMAIQRGDLVGIVGGMASGKSTLISALSGELKKTKGIFHMFDKMVTVPNR